VITIRIDPEIHSWLVVLYGVGPEREVQPKPTLGDRRSRPAIQLSI